jgi:hypothetical protein
VAKKIAVAAFLLAALALPTDSPAQAQGAQGEPVAPAPYLTPRLDDQGNGWARYVWLDAQGRVYDLGPVVRLPSLFFPAPVAQGIEGMIRAAARRWGLSEAVMVRIARCESGLDPRAYNRSSGASGVFQAIPSTWRATPQGRNGASPFDAAPNIEAAMWLMKNYGPSQWVCRG